MKNLIAFHGSDHKSGTTMISQCIAEYLAENYRKLKVLWIVCGRGGGEEYASSVGETMEGLKGYLDNHLIRKEEVMQSCRKTENLYMLGGVQSLLSERCYFPQTAEYLLQCMEQEFDLMIADCGNNIDHGLAVGALSYGGQNVLLTRQSEVAMRRMSFMKDIYSGLHISFSHLVVNGFSEERGMLPQEIMERLGMKEISFHLICQAEQAQKAESEKRTLLSCGSRKFRKDISILSDWVLEACDLEQPKKKGIQWKNFI